jgi:hypothetical protein
MCGFNFTSKRRFGSLRDPLSDHYVMKLQVKSFSSLLTIVVGILAIVLAGAPQLFAESRGAPPKIQL